jgi:phytoene desaturase
MSSKNTIGVIGGGLGGLAAACTLRARGYEVILFERGDTVGGKAVQLEQDGFRFDMGPTIVTLPSVIRKIFLEAGRTMEDHLDLRRLDPQWRSFFNDGSRLDLQEDVETMSQSLDSFAPGKNSGRNYARFISSSARLHDISKRHFFYKPIGGLKDMFKPGESFKPGLIGDILALRMGRTVAETVRSFNRDPRVAQLIDHFTQYVGSSPYGSPAVLCGIAHMQTDEGVWYPMGGTRAVPAALEKLAIELGVEIRLATGIEEILVSGDSVKGVRCGNGEKIALAAVISNCDSVLTHQRLLKGSAAKAFAGRRNYEPACSGVVLYLGLKNRYEHLAHHNFVFSRDPHEEFEYIYKRGEPAPDPTCYLAATTCSEPENAPPGGEALYVLVHAPYLRPHHDWKRMLPAYRNQIIRKLQTTGAMPDIEDRIVFEKSLTPQSIQDRYNVWKGAIYGLASHGRFLGAFKPGNRSPDVRGLYLAGGSAHPGPGMPMAIMSGWIAADALDQDCILPKAEKLEWAT